MPGKQNILQMPKTVAGAVGPKRKGALRLDLVY